jgi:Domain of unknown function (DUF397)
MGWVGRGADCARRLKASAISLVDLEGDPMADPNSRVLLVWRKSSFSEAGGCVEVAARGRSVLARDSKDPSGPTLSFSARSWRTFIININEGPLSDSDADLGQ